MMNKIQAFLSAVKNNIPELIFLAFSARLIMIGANIGEAIALVSFVGIYGFFKFLDKAKVTRDAEIQKQIDDLKNAIQSVKMAQGLRKTNESQANNPNKRYF